MHQTFYIDADEEISSVIDRLNKSVSADNYFVVPKRAIFLQSIVNLKLLKREAEKLGKHLVIVTQDEIGASMAQRAGLEVQAGVEVTGVVESEEIPQIFEDEPESEIDDYEVQVSHIHNKKNRLKSVGSNDFYESMDSLSGVGRRASDVTKSKTKKIPVNSIAKKEGRVLDKKNSITDLKKIAREEVAVHKSAKSLRVNGIDPGKERVLEKMFASNKRPKEAAESKVHEVSGLAKKIFMGFVGLCLLLFVAIAVYLFLPSAKIIITPNVLTEKIDVVILGNTEISRIDQKNMPIRVIDKEDKITETYEVSGTGAGLGKKAHGNVVIYNEYSSAPQTLVATTRIESSDGKIFRLAKSVVVPGTTTVGSETKAGAIEAEVVADESGADFNIAPTSFKIPGFKEGPKYEKFYAKSTTSFTGGSSEGGSSQKIVTQKDVDVAKQKTEELLRNKLREAVAGEIKDGEVVLEQAEKITVVKTGTTAKVGDMRNDFEYSVTMSVRALVFTEKDAREIVEQTFSTQKDSKESKQDISRLEYGVSVADFEKNTLELKIHSEMSITPFIDTEKIKKEMLGKKDDQLGAVLKNYTSIKSVNVEFQPTFVSRIPQYSQRVSVEIKNNAQ